MILLNEFIDSNELSKDEINLLLKLLEIIGAHQKTVIFKDNFRKRINNG